MLYFHIHFPSQILVFMLRNFLFNFHLKDINFHSWDNKCTHYTEIHACISAGKLRKIVRENFCSFFVWRRESRSTLRKMSIPHTYTSYNIICGEKEEYFHIEMRMKFHIERVSKCSVREKKKWRKEEIAWTEDMSCGSLIHFSPASALQRIRHPKTWALVYRKEK